MLFRHRALALVSPPSRSKRCSHSPGRMFAVFELDFLSLSIIGPLVMLASPMTTGYDPLSKWTKWTIRCFSGIVPNQSPPAPTILRGKLTESRKTTLRTSYREHEHTPISHLAGTGIEIPVPIDVEPLSHNRLGPQPAQATNRN